VAQRRTKPASWFLPRLTVAALRVECGDSRALYYSDGFDGRSGNWAEKATRSVNVFGDSLPDDANDSSAVALG
jgi:hypothetical protein